jgi:hypothetical protein
MHCSRAFGGLVSCVQSRARRSGSKKVVPSSGVRAGWRTTTNTNKRQGNTHNKTKQTHKTQQNIHNQQQHTNTTNNIKTTTTTHNKQKHCVTSCCSSTVIAYTLVIAWTLVINANIRARCSAVHCSHSHNAPHTAWEHAPPQSQMSASAVGSANGTSACGFSGFSIHVGIHVTVPKTQRQFAIAKDRDPQTHHHQC